MFSHIAVASLALAVCQAALLEQAHSISSQNILRHDQPQYYQQASILAHSAPVLTHGPVFAQHGPLVSHAAPVVAHAAPVVAHAAPVLAHAGPVVAHGAPVAIGHAAPIVEAPARYEFSYSVDDPITGDRKAQHESRDGDAVRGEYSLVQPDGILRRVEYTADDHNGFNAIVHNAPAGHAAPSPVIAAAPILAHH